MASLSSFDQWQELAFLGAGIALAGIQRAWRSWRMARSQTWPVAYGRIVRSEASEQSKVFSIKLFYRYSVDQDSYQGEFKKKMGSEDDATLWADALRDKQITVHYDPEKLSRSEIWESDLVPIVQSAPPRLHVAQAKETSTAKRVVFLAGIAFTLVGLVLTLVEFLGALAGQSWVGHALSSLVMVGGWIMFLVAAVSRKGTSPRHAAPAWMSFALHALTYFALLTLLFLPAHQATRRSRDTRMLSYQILFYFGAFETFYVRLKDAEEDQQPGFANPPLGP